MAPSNRSPRIWLPCSGLHLAGPRSSAAVQWRCRSCETGAALAQRLRLGLGNESAKDRRRNPALGRKMEGTFRRMKKIVITLVKLGVTFALLWYVYNDPIQRHKMHIALTAADYR